MSGRGENAGVSEPLKSTDNFRRAMRNRDLSSGARVWTRMLLLSLTVALTCPASEPSRHAVTRATPDPYIAAALRQISSARIQANIVVILASKLENDSTPEWDASPGASRYEALWRATSSPDWEHAQEVGSSTAVTLPLSKDNVIFAVRALDRKGHRSLPVVPEPKR